MASVLGDKDINASMEQQTQQQQQQQQTKDVKTMDYHRQILQGKISQEPYVRDKALQPAAVNSSSSSSSSSSSTSDDTNSSSTMDKPRWPTNMSFASRAKQYVSPSDNIMSPCSAKINALRNKQVTKYVIPVHTGIKCTRRLTTSLLLSI